MHEACDSVVDDIDWAGDWVSCYWGAEGECLDHYDAEGICFAWECEDIGL